MFSASSTLSSTMRIRRAAMSIKLLRSSRRYAGVSTAIPAPRFAAPLCGRGAGDVGDPDAKGRAALRWWHRLFQGDRSAVRLGDPAAKCQPQPAALRLGREQRLEDLFALRDRDAGAVVTHTQHRRAAGPLRFDPDPPLAAHRL